jgi:ankyrin repeat protein
MDHSREYEGRLRYSLLIREGQPISIRGIASSCLMNAVLLLALAAAIMPEAAGQDSVNKVSFSGEIKPLIERSCLGCHGGDLPKGRFSVDNRESILKGGSSGEPAVLIGDSERSPLVRYVSGLIDEMEMPPLDSRDQFPALSEQEIQTVRRWIDEGAVWPSDITLSLPRSQKLSGKTAEGGHENHIGRLVAACRSGETNLVSSLLSDASNLTTQDADGNTALMYAAFYLDASLVKAILSKGANSSVTNKAGTTALMMAVSSPEKVRVLLEHGADVNISSASGNTALIVAAYQFGSSPVLEELLKRGAKVNVANNRKVTPLFAAAQVGDPDAIQLLLKHGADVNSKGEIPNHTAPVTALMCAAVFGHFDCVKLLVEKGADVHWISEYGNVMNFAAFTDRKEVARFLVSRGVRVDLPGRRIASARGDTGLTPLMYASMSERNDSSLVELLLANGADPTARASSGETALSLARTRGDTKIVAVLNAAVAEADNQPAVSELRKRF